MIIPGSAAGTRAFFINAKINDTKSVLIELKEIPDQAMRTIAEAKRGTVVNQQAEPPGGIDLNTSNGMQWKVSKDGSGVEMNIDPAMIARIRRQGIDSLSPVIFKITPVTSVWPLLGLQAPVKGNV